MTDAQSISSWTTEDVAEWLKQNHFDRYVDLFTKQHKIDGRALALLTENDLRSPPLALSVLGDIKHLMICLKELMSSHHHHPLMSNESYTGNGTVNHASSNMSRVYYDDEEHPGHGLESPRSRARARREYDKQISQHLKPEFKKLFLSYLYMFIVFMVTAFMMVIVHDRVPDMDKYPPLPDIMLDNLPYIPWAFEACEATAVVLAAILSCNLIFHKHR